MPVRARADFGYGSTTLRAIHRYLGLAVGIVICLLGLSGSMLVFRPELERVLRPDLFYVSPASTASATLEEMRAIALASSPGLELYRIRLAADEHSSYEFILGSGGTFTDYVYVDPNSRRVLGVRKAGSDFFLWLQSLHFDLLAGEKGRRINGGVATALLILGLSRLLLWVRATPSVIPRLWPRWRVRTARRNWGVHVSFGFWSLPFLVLIATTALYFAFHNPVARFIYAVTHTAPLPALPRTESSGDRVSLDILLAKARVSDPAGRYTVIRLARASGQHITFNYVLPGDLSDLGANAIHCDPSTGAVLRIDRLRDMELGARVVAALVPLHFGTFGGLPTRIIWAFLGLLPSLLFVSGVAVWRHRRLRSPLNSSIGRSERHFESVWEVKS